jgi:hypothetical protein
MASTSTNIFDTTLLNNEPARYTVIAEACLPGFLFLIVGYFMFRDVVLFENLIGHPDSLFDRMTWFVMIALWTIGLVVAALNFSPAALAVVGATSLLAILFGALWMYYITAEASEAEKSAMAPQVLYVACVGILTSAITAAGNGATEQARLAVGGMLAPVAMWMVWFLAMNITYVGSTHVQKTVKRKQP